MVSGRQIRPALIRWVVLAKRKAGRIGLGGGGRGGGGVCRGGGAEGVLLYTGN